MNIYKTENLNIYKITADYRPNNPKKPTYYVGAKNKKDARKKWMAVYSWLKIYDIEEIHDVSEIDLSDVFFGGVVNCIK